MCTIPCPNEAATIVRTLVVRQIRLESLSESFSKMAVLAFKLSSLTVLQLKLMIAKISRVIEVCGYSISLLVLFFALLAFCYFR